MPDARERVPQPVSVRIRVLAPQFKWEARGRRRGRSEDHRFSRESTTAMQECSTSENMIPMMKKQFPNTLDVTPARQPAMASK